MARQGIPAPHSFTLSPGRYLCPEYAARVPSIDDDGAYCCLKGFVRDLELQQDPILVLPGRCPQLPTQAPMQVLRRTPLTKKEINDAVRIADLCRLKWNMPEAAAALLLYVQDRTYSFPPLPWLDGPLLQANPEPVQGNTYFPQLPKCTWKLMVKSTDMK